MYDSDLLEKCNYANNIKEGICEEWADTRSDETEGSNNQLVARTNYKNGKKYGLHQEWHRNGQLAVKCRYVNRDRKGLYEAWDNKGNPKQVIRNF